MDDGYKANLYKRFKDRRPGLQLLAIEDAAIPVTIVRTDVLAQERKGLPLIEEFILRFTVNGVVKIAEISSLMGLSENMTNNAASVQISANNLQYKASTKALTATPQGKEIAREMAAVKPVLRQLPVIFDRVTWKMADHSPKLAITKKDAEERGLILLPPAKTERIKISDITEEEFNALLKKSGRRAATIEVLTVRKISPHTHKYLPVQLLVYGNPDKNEAQLAVYLDEDISTSHDLALQSTDAVAKLGITVGPPEHQPALDEDIVKLRTDQPPVGAPPAESQDPATDIGPADSAEPTDQVRVVGVTEHPDLLNQALLGSKTRLLIISPWVKGAIVNAKFIRHIEERLRAGATVHIAHGYGKDDSGSDERALKRLRDLAQQHPRKFTLARLTNTHAKVLIADGIWVNTSFNWLSFKGDPSRTYRMEEGTVVTIPAKVDQMYERYLDVIARENVT